MRKEAAGIFKLRPNVGGLRLSMLAAPAVEFYEMSIAVGLPTSP
jgi:hypothetical protein